MQFFIRFIGLIAFHDDDRIESRMNNSGQRRRRAALLHRRLACVQPCRPRSCGAPLVPRAVYPPASLPFGPQVPAAAPVRQGGSIPGGCAVQYTCLQDCARGRAGGARPRALRVCRVSSPVLASTLYLKSCADCCHVETIPAQQHRGLFDGDVGGNPTGQRRRCCEASDDRQEPRASSAGR